MKSRLGALILVAACGGGGGGNNQPPVDAPPAHPDAPSTPDATPDAPPVPTGTVAITLKSLDALAYTAPLTLGGTQHQDVIVDTGSSSLGVAASGCSNCGVTPLYMPGSSAVDQHAPTSAMYGDGSGWSGEIYQDMVALGMAATVPVKFSAITSSSMFFRSFDTGAPQYQGIMGLGPDALLSMGTTSYVSAAVTAGMTPVMAFRMCQDSGTMWLGGVDPAAQGPSPVTTPMTAGFPFYAVNVSDVAVAGTSLGVQQSGYGPTIIDTGTSISFIPTAALTALTSAISGSTGYKAVFGTQALSEMTCMTTDMTAAQIDAMLPPLEVTFAGATGTPADVPATRSYLVAAGGNMWCYAFGDSSQLFGNAITASLYGDSLLAGYTTSFDVGNKQMTFAPEAGCATPHASPALAHPAPHYTPGIPWWRQDPRVHLPTPAKIQHWLAAH